jgi:hypothetical protein
VEDGSNKSQAVIHIIHSELQFPSKYKVSLVYVTFVTTFVILLLPEHLRIALVRNHSISVPCLYKIFSMFWATALTLQFSVFISEASCNSLRLHLGLSILNTVCINCKTLNRIVSHQHRINTSNLDTGKPKCQVLLKPQEVREGELLSEGAKLEILKENGNQCTDHL